MRVVSTRVLPLPAPARISADWAGSSTAARCSGLRPESREEFMAQLSHRIALCRLVASTNENGEPVGPIPRRCGRQDLQLLLDHLMQDRSQDELHRKTHLAAW